MCALRAIEKCLLWRKAEQTTSYWKRRIHRGRINWIGRERESECERLRPGNNRQIRDQKTGRRIDKTDGSRIGGMSLESESENVVSHGFACKEQIRSAMLRYFN